MSALALYVLDSHGAMQAAMKDRCSLKVRMQDFHSLSPGSIPGTGSFCRAGSYFDSQPVWTAERPCGVIAGQASASL